VYLSGVTYLPRRAALATIGAGLGWGAAACAGFRVGAARSVPDDVVLCTVWAGSAEQAAFTALAEGFREATGVPVQVQVVPFSQATTSVDTGLRAGAAPDVFRVTYNDAGFYAAAGVLARPGPDALAPFTPAFRSAVSDDAGAFGVPHHTDTSMLLVNTDAAQEAGLGALPAEPSQAWTWDEFADAARRIKASRPGRYPFAVNWQNAGAYRWLNWVDQAGGRLLAADLRAAAPATDPGLARATAFTRSFFTEGLAPPTSSTTGTDASDLFTTQTVAMAFVGDFLLESISAVDFPWQAVPLPRDAVASADLGGNALVATAGPRQAQALEFLAWCVDRDRMAQFCSATTVLPTRTDLDAAALRYTVAPDAMARYVQQATAIRPELVEQVTVPAAARINAELRDGLDRAFLGADPDSAVLGDLVGAVDRAVKR
jgi:multiple sugar transport system substrate-binding protein